MQSEFNMSVSHKQRSVSEVTSPGMPHNNKQRSVSEVTSPGMCSNVPVTRPTSISLSSTTSTDSGSNGQCALLTNHGNGSTGNTSEQNRNHGNNIRRKEEENEETAKTTSPSSGMRGLIKDSSICGKDGLCIYHFNLTFYGHIVLDKRITQPMLPWIISEKVRGNKQTSQAIYLQVSGKGAIGISESQGLILFDHKPSCISRFCRGHPKNSFGYLWRPNSDSDFKCFIYDAPDAETVGFIDPNC